MAELKGGTTIGGKLVYHSGNSNLSNIDWTVDNLTANTITSTASAASRFIDVNGGDFDSDLWRIGNVSGYGFYLRYNGTGSADDNSLSMWTEGLASTDILSYEIKQSGIVHFSTRIYTAGLTVSSTILGSNSIDIGNQGLQSFRHISCTGSMYADDSLVLNWDGTNDIILNSDDDGMDFEWNTENHMRWVATHGYAYVGSTASTTDIGIAALSTTNPTTDYTYLYQKGNVYGGLFYRQGNSYSDMRMEYNYWSWNYGSITSNYDYEVAKFSSTEVVFNEDSNDIDFRVESADNPMMFNVISQATTPYVQINAYDTGTTPPTRAGETGTVLELHETNAYLLISNRSGSGECGIKFVDYGSYTTQTARIAYDCTSYNLNFYVRGGVTTETPAARMDPISTTQADLLVTGNVVAYSTYASDIRLKKDIKPLETSLDIIQKFDGISYVRKSSGEKHLGYIAQDVEEFMPELIYETDILGEEEGVKYKTLRYTEIIPIITEAMKEQQLIINDLKDEIEKLKEKLNLK